MPAEPARRTEDYSAAVLKTAREIASYGEVSVPTAYDSDADWFVHSLRLAVPGVAVSRSGHPGSPPVLLFLGMRFWTSWARDGAPVTWRDAQNKTEPEILLFLDSAPNHIVREADGLPIRPAAKCLVAALEKLGWIKARRELFVIWAGIRIEALGMPQPKAQRTESRVIALVLDHAKVQACCAN